ncbi:hypothetical protein [Phaeovulum vinaykumarii]|uniref:Uncharacterized protein n=1 Tax=Phaeovulum vinaykumarii TaxID=407234 RepID=A0A1N7JSA6_9RHOB|nr:hypothetical protein [Phaeovulum vinaykumarii]SIS52106.1 hypothetical protein SAMN05421795_101282 [Phaeovulum vinaykumarii]SOB91082.1 hypothetical protein SAMN05878426_101282 [Phaeovulum vinaykumarii]
MIRPAARAFLARHAELAAAAGCGAAGLWLATRGGWFLAAVGGALAAVAAGWAVIALRRLAFLRAPSGPGVVEIDEGQIGWLGPAGGGYAALRDIDAVALVERPDGPAWDLRLADGRRMQVPLAAAGAGALYDAFASLPGIDMAALARAAAGATIGAGDGAGDGEDAAAGAGPVSGPPGRVVAFPAAGRAVPLWRRPRGPGAAGGV